MSSSYHEIKELVRKAILEILLEEPEILLEVLVKRPDLIQNALIKVAPWASILSAVEAVKRDMATKKDLELLKNDLEAVKRDMATKKDLEALEKRIQIRLDALGARWGLVNEETVRAGIRDLMKEAGYMVEKWIWYDKDGKVYGYPSTIDLDVVVRDEVLVIVEIASSLKRGEYIFIKKKAELYESVTGRKPSKIIIITPFIADKDPYEVILRAKEAGIDIIAPESIATKSNIII